MPFWEKKMIKVGILDTSVNSTNSHGNKVASCIGFEHHDIEIVSCKVLDENDRGRAEELITGIEYCIAQNVDVINISAGIRKISYDNLKRLIDSCEKAHSKGITIIAAANNKGEISYPACFDSVLTVTEKRLLSERTDKKLSLAYDSSMVASKTNEDDKFLTGNSFLCALTTGIFAAFLEAGCLDPEKRKDASFVKLWNDLYDNGMITSAAPSGSVEDYGFIRLTEENFLDSDLISRLKLKKIYSLSDLSKKSFQRGILGNPSYPVSDSLKKELIDKMIGCDMKTAYAVTPVFSVFERYMIKKRYGITVSNVYM